MTPFATAVTNELRSAIVPLETVSIVDHQHLDATIRALLNNALFYVTPSQAIVAGRERAVVAARSLAAAIHAGGVQTRGISLDVDRARSDAVVAMQDLAHLAVDAEPTMTARCLGII